ncbi:hypothetical protein QOZ95_002336 [Paenibacillus brasilensis]|uniref:Uncharacterized protein n=1 Tax=Paenibacillus brasilensis TaxID=128574 RepID=A0ABU0KXL0_9BACL|nr:hypothetical protein [Paenibacillus brasilensis]
MDLFLVVLNILVILISIAGGVLLIGLLYRGHTLLGLLIAEKKNKKTILRKKYRKQQSPSIFKVSGDCFTFHYLWHSKSSSSVIPCWQSRWGVFLFILLL